MCLSLSWVKKSCTSFWKLCETIADTPSLMACFGIDCCHWLCLHESWYMKVSGGGGLLFFWHYNICAWLPAGVMQNHTDEGTTTSVKWYPLAVAARCDHWWHKVSVHVADSMFERNMDWHPQIACVSDLKRHLFTQRHVLSFSQASCNCWQFKHSLISPFRQPFPVACICHHSLLFSSFQDPLQDWTTKKTDRL